MKSSLINIENLNKDIEIEYTIRLKPLALLIFGFVLGIFCYWLGSPVSEIGLFGSVICIFLFTMLPDRILLQFADDQVLLYSRDTPGEVRILYYDEIVNYEYITGRSEDTLIFYMIDGSNYSVEIFNKRKMKRILSEKLPFKDKNKK